MNRVEIEAKFIDLVEGNLNSEEAKQLMATIEADQQLSTSFEEYRQTVLQLRALHSTQNFAPKELKDRIMNEIRSLDLPLKPTLYIPGWTKRSDRFKSWFVAALSATVCITVCMVNYSVLTFLNEKELFIEDASIINPTTDSIDYIKVKKFLDEDMLPQNDLIKVDEFLKYFDDNCLEQKKPVEVNYEIAPSSLESETYLLQIKIQALIPNLKIAATEIQLAFNRDVVESHRVIGYYSKDSALQKYSPKGDIRHQITAVYELTLAQKPYKRTLGLLNVRFTNTSNNRSDIIKFPLKSSKIIDSADDASNDFRFASAVTYFAQMLANEKPLNLSSLKSIRKLALEVRKDKDVSSQKEFIELIQSAEKSIEAMNKKRAREERML